MYLDPPPGFRPDLDVFVPATAADRREAARLLARDELRPVPGGAYLSAHAPDTLAVRAAALAHVLRTRADAAGRARRADAAHLPDPADWSRPAAPRVAGVVPHRGAVALRTAVWVHAGGPLPRGADPVEVAIVPGASRARSGQVSHEYRLVPGDVEEIEGLAVTCAVRTAADVARSLPPGEAVALLERLRRSCGLGVGDLIGRLEAMPHGRGVAKARETALLWAGSWGPPRDQGRFVDPVIR